jgi:1-acyl-sn-glycerol-3-phosphate acyltransferase
MRSQIGASGRPVVILSNHSSFLDTILIVTMMPLTQIGKVKMFVSSHLLKMPFLGSIVRAMGHLVVPFKSTGTEGFELDKDLMAERQMLLQEHLQCGGYAAWFPEGRMNRGDTTVVERFRAGGFSLASNVDVEIWCIALQGVAKCWPGNAAVGGRPSRIGAKVTKFCNSSFAFLADNGLATDDSRARCLMLADGTQNTIQVAVSELAAQGFTDRQPSSKGDVPLLGNQA